MGNADSTEQFTIELTITARYTASRKHYPDTVTTADEAGAYDWRESDDVIELLRIAGLDLTHINGSPTVR